MSNDRLDGMGTTISGLLDHWQVPGLGVLVVRGSERIFAQGFGLRDVENQLPVDEDTLFYLLSRGIPHDTARRMLVGAFAAEALDEIGQPAIRDWFSARIDAWLDSHIGALPDIGDDAS